MQFVTLLLTALFRLGVVAGAAIFALSLLVAGLLAAMLLTLWRLLHGRRPSLRFGLGLSTPLRHTLRRRSGERGRPVSAAGGDVIEGHARELG